MMRNGLITVHVTLLLLLLTKFQIGFGWGKDLFQEPSLNFERVPIPRRQIPTESGLVHRLVS